MIYVIGSGPSGVSAVVALVNKGLDVTMLDAGFDLEPERMEVVHQLRAVDKKSWNSKLISKIKEGMEANPGGVDQKLIYGSDYPYRGIETYQPVEMNGAKMCRSLAKGGLSTVWGGSVLPSRQEDILDWPITIKDLEPHYRAILSFMPQCCREDQVSSLLDLYAAPNQTLRLCSQASELLNDLEKNQKALNSEKIFFGLSRLAGNFDLQGDSPECSYCSMCLYGCPYDKIYSSSHTIEALSAKDNFHYIPGVMVEKLIETNTEVRILAKSFADSKEITFQAKRVFVAAGVLSSTRMILQSLEAFDHSIDLKHSDLFQLPLIRYKATKKVISEELHTLTQMYIEILDDSISKNTIHMQLYFYNDLYKDVLNKMAGPLAPLLQWPIQEMLGRLLIIKGYFHSDISSHISLRLEPGEKGRLLVQGYPSDEAKKAFRKLYAKMLKNRKHFKAVPSPVMAKLFKPGMGNHSGGTFPMRKNPSNFESDTLGRPCGFNRVHVVDSTVFPSIPGTTITLTIMANAHRIASVVSSEI